MLDAADNRFFGRNSPAVTAFPPQVRAVQALPDGRLASASQDHTARFWVPKQGAGSGAGGVFYEIGGTPEWYTVLPE